MSCRENLQNFVVSDCLLAVGLADDLPRTVIDVGNERKVDSTRITCLQGNPVFQNGSVGLLYLTVLELLLQLLLP